MIGIINCGGANLQSVMYALDRINMKYKVSDTWNDLKNSRALILPGVGAAGTVMRNLKNLNLITKTIEIQYYGCKKIMELEQISL